MKVSAQEIEQRQMVLDIEVEDERVQRALDQAYKRIVNRINVPGFRRGRAPRPLVERMVGREAILEDAVEHLVPQVYQDALKEQQITPGGQPSLEVTSTEPLQLKATVPLQPHVELGDYRSIQVDRETAEVDETEVETVIQALRESNASWAPVERPVQVGDRVGLDVKATNGERTLIDARDAEFVVDPEGNEPLPGFSQQLLGLEAGREHSFTSNLTESAKGEAAESADVTVRVHWVKQKELPELDDEFARTLSKDSADLLRRDVRERLQRQKQQEARERQREATVDAAVEQARVEVPPQAVEREANHLLHNMAAGLDKQGISIEQYLKFTGKDESQLRSELLARGDRTLKRSLVLEAIAEAEGLQVSEAEIRHEIELASQSASDPARTAREALGRSETRDRIKSVLQTQKGLERLLELAGFPPAEIIQAEPAETTPSHGDTNA